MIYLYFGQARLVEQKVSSTWLQTWTLEILKNGGKLLDVF